MLDTDSHASIYDGSRLGGAEVIRFRHNWAEDLTSACAASKARPGDRLIVVEGIYSMLGDTAPLKEIAAVSANRRLSDGRRGPFARLLGAGLGWPNGRLEEDVDFIVGTFSKSLGGIGGFCVSDHADFDFLRFAAVPTCSPPPSAGRRRLDP